MLHLYNYYILSVNKATHIYFEFILSFLRFPNQKIDRIVFSIFSCFLISYLFEKILIKVWVDS